MSAHILRRLGTRRPARSPQRAGGAPEPPTLEQQIIALYEDAGWTVHALFLPRIEYVTLSGSLVDQWDDVSGNNHHATASGTARPTWSTTAINGMRGMTLDGGDSLLTGAIDSGAATAYVMHVLFRDTTTGAAFVAEWGDLAGDRTIALNVNAGSAGTLDVYADGAAGATSLASRARSAASFAMTDPAVVTGTWDAALATNETEIRHAGSNVTSTRPNNSNNTGGLGSQSLIIGARKAGNALAGAISHVCIAAGSTAIPLTAVAAVEALLAADQGL